MFFTNLAKKNLYFFSENKFNSVLDLSISNLFVLALINYDTLLGGYYAGFSKFGFI
jgi:hypothetical protein